MLVRLIVTDRSKYEQRHLCKCLMGELFNIVPIAETGDLKFKHQIHYFVGYIQVMIKY